MIGIIRIEVIVKDILGFLKWLVIRLFLSEVGCSSFSSPHGDTIDHDIWKLFQLAGRSRLLPETDDDDCASVGFVTKRRRAREKKDEESYPAGCNYQFVTGVVGL